MVEQTKTIAEINNFIVLDKYKAKLVKAERYQSESELENELIDDLVNQGYEYLPELNNNQAMLANIRIQLQPFMICCHLPKKMNILKLKIGLNIKY